MKGIMGLPQVMLNTGKANQNTGSKNNSDCISFSQFMQRWSGQRVNVPRQKIAIGKEEEGLLEKSLVHLLNYKLKLNSVGDDKNLTSEQLKKLLEKMAGDMDFFDSLTPELKAMLQKLLTLAREFDGTGKLDLKTVDELLQAWKMNQEKRRQKELAEVEELIAAIEARLAQAGIQAKAQLVEKDGHKSVKVSFMQSAPKNDSEGQVLAKGLLNRIANFLGETDGTAEKSELQKGAFDLKEDLKRFLNKESTPANWRKEELIHRAQYGTLHELTENQSELATAANLTKETVALTNVEQLIKSEGKGETELNLLKEGDEVQVLQKLHEAENFAELFSQGENSKETKTDFAQMVRQGVRSYLTDPQQLFEQMVEKFRMDLKQGLSQMQIQLHPQELGRLNLSLTLEKGVITAHFVAESAKVKELIEQNLPQLRETFAKEGIRWEQVTVDVGQDTMQENPFTSQSQRDTRDQRHSNKRRNFNDTMLEEMELGEEEERVKDPTKLLDYLA